MTFAITKHPNSKVFKKEKGFTFVELIVVLAIIAGIVTFGVNILGGTSARNMRETGVKLLRVVNYVYHQASLTGSFYRLVFDLDKQKYFVEYSDTPFYVIREGDEVEQIRIKNEEKLGADENEETESSAAAAGNFSESEDDLLEIFALPDNIKFADIRVSHQLEKATSGKVYLYFFPKGYTEFCVIHLSDVDEEEFLTLTVNPLSAHVDVKDEYIEYEDALENLEGK